MFPGSAASRSCLPSPEISLMCLTGPSGPCFKICAYAARLGIIIVAVTYHSSSYRQGATTAYLLLYVDDNGAPISDSTLYRSLAGPYSISPLPGLTFHMLFSRSVSLCMTPKSLISLLSRGSYAEGVLRNFLGGLFELLLSFSCFVRFVCQQYSTNSLGGMELDGSVYCGYHYAHLLHGGSPKYQVMRRVGSYYDKSRTSVLTKGPSPIVISKAFMITGSEELSFPETRGNMIFPSPRVDSSVDFLFEVPFLLLIMRTGALVTPDTYSCRVRGLRESDSIWTCRMTVYFMVDGEVVRKFLLPSRLPGSLLGFWTGGISLELVRAFLVIIRSSIGRLLLLRSKCKFSPSEPYLQSIFRIHSNESSSAFSFLLLDVMYCEMCLRELLMLAKMGSKLCIQIFIVENATYLLTIPPSSGGIFKHIREHMTGHGHRPFLHMNGTFEEVGGPPREELPPEPGKDGSWVARRLPPCSALHEICVPLGGIFPLMISGPVKFSSDVTARVDLIPDTLHETLKLFCLTANVSPTTLGPYDNNATEVLIVLLCLIRKPETIHQFDTNSKLSQSVLLRSGLYIISQPRRALQYLTFTRLTFHMLFEQSALLCMTPKSLNTLLSKIYGRDAHYSSINSGLCVLWQPSSPPGHRSVKILSLDRDAEADIVVFATAVLKLAVTKYITALHTPQATATLV
ncbi:hypothetical protein Tco_1044371 [Tanacetum coccineum]|uniref:Uncharacterized protein n=1 Tax=Tanacetum coccineum TaxID=301880 RepID=A0ABQ5GPR1_9ASTR